MLMLGSFLWLNFKDIRFQAAVQQSKATNTHCLTYPSKLEERKRGLNPVWNLGWAAVSRLSYPGEWLFEFSDVSRRRTRPRRS